MVAPDNTNQHEQEHAVVQEKKDVENPAAKQKIESAKVAVVLDQFEIQHRRFFGK